MGLDVAFDFEKAKAAGMIIKYEANGSEQDWFELHESIERDRARRDAFLKAVEAYESLGWNDDNETVVELKRMAGVMHNCIARDIPHLEWLKEMEPLCALPDKYKQDEYWRSVWEDKQGGAHVRANKWGDFYIPLTKFLKDNNIEWDEY